MKEIIVAINNSGNKIFHDPTPLHDYNYLIEHSLGSNTFRGFHKIDKLKPGSKDAFYRLFDENAETVITQLKQIKSEQDLHNFNNELCNRLESLLSYNIKSHQLTSYNKLRKPIDIVVEHLIAMCHEFADVRNKITKYLFLPLDSMMFSSQIVFSDEEIKTLSLNRKFTFKDITNQSHYIKIQDFLIQKTQRVNLEERIFFDLLWNRRYLSSGTNLLLTNPSIK